MLTNVTLALTPVMKMPSATTHLDPSGVSVTMVTVEMELHVHVSYCFIVCYSLFVSDYYASDVRLRLIML